MSGTVFVSHVEEDADLALGIALALEAEGFGTWCYEIDSVPGPSYLIQTGRAIDRSKAMILVISPHSIGSHQVTRELVRAYESNIKFIPVLRDVTHLEFQTRQPEWREALGASASVRTPADGAGAIMGRICEGLRALGVEPGAPSSAARLAALRSALARAPAHRPGADPSAAVAGGAPSAEAWSRHESTARGGRVVGSTPAARSLRLLVLLAVVGALAAVYWASPHFASRDGATTGEAVRADTRPGAPGSQAVGVMEIRARGEVPDWMRDFTRDGLNTILSKAGVPVYAKQKIDFLRERRGLSEIEAAEQLGIQKMVSGTLRMLDSRVVLEVEVVDIKTGMLQDSETVQGPQEHLVELQNQIALSILRRMNVQLSPEQVKIIFAARTDDTLDNYKLLTETLDPGSEQQGRPQTGAESPPYALSFPWTAVAWAGEDVPEESAIRTALEHYRRALEQKDLDTLTALSVTMSEGQREALARYFENADRLQIQFSNFDILLEGDEALATFTRADSFKDVRSGRDMHLEVRISSVLAKQGDGWKIRALKRPS